MCKIKLYNFYHFSYTLVICSKHICHKMVSAKYKFINKFKKHWKMYTKVFIDIVNEYSKTVHRVVNEW